MSVSKKFDLESQAYSRTLIMKDLQTRAEQHSLRIRLFSDHQTPGDRFLANVMKCSAAFKPGLPSQITDGDAASHISCFFIDGRSQTHIHFKRIGNDFFDDSVHNTTNITNLTVLPDIAATPVATTGFIPTKDGRPRKKRRRYSEKEWKKIFDFALLLLRIDPSIPSYEKLTEYVSKVYPGVVGSDFSRDDGKNKDDFQNFKARRGHLRPVTKKERKPSKAVPREGRESDPSKEAELDDELKVFCRNEELPVTKREALIRLCIAKPELAIKLQNFFRERR